MVGWLVPGQPDRNIVAWWKDPGLWAAGVWALAVFTFNTTASTALGQVTGTLVACPLLAAGMSQRVWRVVAAGALAMVVLLASALIRDTPFEVAQRGARAQESWWRRSPGSASRWHGWSSASSW